MPDPSAPVVIPTALPDVLLDATSLADVELALLGVIPDADVVLNLGSDIAAAVRAAGGAVLRDAEHTPLAELTVDSTDRPGGAVTGSYTRRRVRESGQGAQYALSVDDLSPESHGPALLVLARPVVDADAVAVAALTSGPGEVVVVVSSAGEVHGIPTAVLLAEARALTQSDALAGRSVLRTAPLAWRDTDSDTALVAMLARAMGSTRVLHLRTDGDEAATVLWRRVRAALDEGSAEPLTGVSAHTDAVLRRWRPRRAHRGLVMMFTGLSGSGKSTLARDVSAAIEEQSTRTLTLLDGDVVRTMLSSGLGFDRASRILNVRRIGFVGAEIARHGGIAVCAPIAPYESTRADVRRMAEQVGDFLLIHVSTPLAVCESRDLKGLYAKARAGLIPEFTGISDPYDVPLDADLSVDTSTMPREAALAVVWDHLVSGGWLTKETT